MRLGPQTLCNRHVLALVLAATCWSNAVAEESAPAVQPDDESGKVRLADLPAINRLPDYTLDIELDTERGVVSVSQKVRWTNPGPLAADELVFHVVPNNRMSKKVLEIGKRTVESLRLNPRTCIDEAGRRFHLDKVRRDDQQLEWSFDPNFDTHLHLQLPEPLPPGETVEVSLDYWLDLPQVQGRFGQYRGVTNLLNWYPVLAVWTDQGWDAVPYVPWHQPWLNEAGNYIVRLRLPADHDAATGGRVIERTLDESGEWQVLEIRGEGLRDFTIVASSRFESFESEFEGIPVRVLAFPEHQGYARVVLQIAIESLKQYSEWFGPYPYREFEIVESYFGWNGNESSGLVMIDERILAAPKRASRYVEHLVSHEICHQWWYSAVGTDGYREPWVDEGLVQWLTRVRIEDKYGSNPDVLQLPGQGAVRLPNIQYRSLVHGGYNLYRSRGGDGNALAPLDEIGHLHNLFFLVYDRGARVVGMIQHRMGRERFFEFLRHLYTNYRFRILRAADFQRELEEFTGESWQEFFDNWLRSGRDSDWKVDEVKVTKTSGGFQTRATFRQTEDINEPIDVAFRFGHSDGVGRQRVVRLDDEFESLQDEAIRIERPSNREWTVTVTSSQKPKQITVDPDGWIIDSNPHNNRWKPDVDFRFSPVYTPLDEADLTQPWQKTGATAGFGIDSDGRIGLRGSVIASNRFRVSPFVGYIAGTGNDYLSGGIDAVFPNFPSPNWQLGARYEYAFLTTLQNDPGEQTRIYLRRILNYTTSLIYPNLSYIDLYTRFGDNFFPDEDSMPADPRVQGFDNVRAFGIAYHVDTQMPYWNPDTGFRFDAQFEHGFEAFGGGATYDRVEGQFAVVHRLPDGLGWLSESKVATRAAAGYGWDDSGEHFRFGGPGRFRGRRPADTEGNAFWLGTLEWRFPLVRELDYEVVDNFASLRSLDAAIFYDVGESFLFDISQGGIDHTIGVGMYFDIPLLSFVENLTVRVEYGRSVTNDVGVFWFGLYRAF